MLRLAGRRTGGGRPWRAGCGRRVQATTPLRHDCANVVTDRAAASRDPVGAEWVGSTARSYPWTRSRTRARAVVPEPARSYPPGALRYDRAQEGTTARHGVRPRLRRYDRADSCDAEHPAGRSGPHEEIAPDAPGPARGRRPEAATARPGACAILRDGAAHPRWRREPVRRAGRQHRQPRSSPLARGVRSEHRHPDRPTARPPSCPRRR